MFNKQYAIHVYHHFDDSILTSILKELQKMPTLQEVKDAVSTAAAQVVTDIQAAVAKETQEVVDQIKAIPVGTTLTQQDLDDLVNSVKGIGPAAATSIDSISVNDGAGGTTTIPLPPPVPNA